MLSAGDTPSLTHYLFCTHVCSPPKIVFILSQISKFVNPENFSDSQCNQPHCQSCSPHTSYLFAGCSHCISAKPADHAHIVKGITDDGRKALLFYLIQKKGDCFRLILSPVRTCARRAHRKAGAAFSQLLPIAGYFSPVLFPAFIRRNIKISSLNTALHGNILRCVLNTVQNAVSTNSYREGFP